MWAEAMSEATDVVTGKTSAKKPAPKPLPKVSKVTTSTVQEAEIPWGKVAAAGGLVVGLGLATWVAVSMFAGKKG